MRSKLEIKIENVEVTKKVREEGAIQKVTEALNSMGVGQSIFLNYGESRFRDTARVVEVLTNKRFICKSEGNNGVRIGRVA